MGTEIATRFDGGGESLAEASDGLNFYGLVDMGSRLIKTNFLPDHIKTGEQFAAIVMTGREMGIPTMRAIRSLQIIKGNVTEKADSQLARFKEAGGRSQFEVLDDTRAVLHLVHPNGDKHTETWTSEDSRKAGLTGGNHSKFPRAMIRSRCITAALKSIGWAGAVGNYDPDELADAQRAGRRQETTAAPISDKPPPPAPQPPVWLPRVQAATTVAELGRISDEADAASLTPQQRRKLEQAIAARHEQIEPEDDGQEHHDAADAEAIS